MKNPPQEVQSSVTVAIHSLALSMCAKGRKVYNLSAGEPVINTGRFYGEDVKKSILAGKTLYPPSAGIPELRKSAKDWMNRLFDTDYKIDNTIVTGGGKFGIYLVMLSLLSKGDEVLVPSPHYLSYPQMLEMVGAKAIFVKGKPEKNWKLCANDFEKYITKKTRMIILNSGSNPSGVLYSKKEIAGFLAFAKKHDLWVLSDEVYSGLTYDEAKYASCASPVATRNRVIVIQSASKSFGMTGWRIGFVFGPKEVMNSCNALQSQILSSTSAVSQLGCITAFKHADKIIKFMRDEMEKRRNVFFDNLEKGLFELGFVGKLQRTASALYAFLPISLFTKAKISDTEFCKDLLEKAFVASVPGSPFGRKDYVRFSFGAEPKELKEAVQALCVYAKRFR